MQIKRDNAAGISPFIDTDTFVSSIKHNHTNMAVVSSVAFHAGAGVWQSARHVPPTLVPAHS